jgi:hypothetical protein
VPASTVGPTTGAEADATKQNSYPKAAKLVIKVYLYISMTLPNQSPMYAHMYLMLHWLSPNACCQVGSAI